MSLREAAGDQVVAVHVEVGEGAAVGVQGVADAEGNNNIYHSHSIAWTLLEIVRVSEVDLAAGVPAAHEAAVVLEDGAGAPSVKQLTLLAFLQVETDHLILDAAQQQLSRSLRVSEHALHF